MPTTVAPRDAHYQSGAVTLAGATKTTIFTVPDGFWWDLVWLRVVKGSGAAGSAAVYVTLAGTEYVWNEAAAFAGGVPYFSDGPLHLEAGDTLKVTAAASNVVFYTVSVGSRHPDSGVAATDAPLGIAGLGIRPRGR